MEENRGWAGMDDGIGCWGEGERGCDEVMRRWNACRV